MLEFLELLLEPLLDGIVERPLVGITVLALLVYGTSFALTGSILPTLFGLLLSLLAGMVDLAAPADPVGALE